MIVLTPTVFECLICMRFLFLYLHLFSAIEHVSHGKSALEIRSLLSLVVVSPQPDRFFGLVVKASASSGTHPGSIPAFPVGISPGRILPEWLPCQAPDDIGSAGTG